MIVIKPIHKYLYIVAILLFGVFPSLLTAKIFIATEIVSGQVMSVSEENTIELDDGFLYYSAKKDITPAIHPGEFISIKYYIDGSYDRIYIEYAPGKNSIRAVPVPERTVRSKKKL